MTLPPGSRLGPYEILAPLGAGGMGEVYRARDARLGREIALKVLPVELSDDADRLSRFEQEARSASALNHPNIVTVHDIGRAGDVSFIAMELVDGKTLRELGASGPLPVRRTLTIATQIAEGLGKAHGAGIVHRDLKPENVMVSKDGFVKILDFGLAKLVEPESGEVSVMPTLARPETHPGVVMGTVGYMSPEQASGEPVDYRSDQFSLGSILYEIATGQKPFQRKTAAETMSAIIREDPEPIGKVRPEVPPPLRWIIERCLAKDPEERYASTRDLARELAGVRDHVSEITGAAEAQIDLGPRPLKRARRSMVLGAALFLLLFGAVGGWLVASKRVPKTSAPTFRRLTFRSGSLQNARFTPDGQTIVYGATWAGEKPGLYAVRPESPESRAFEFPADILAVSSTGEMAVLLNQNPIAGTLARVPFAGGVPRPVVEDVPYASADWSPDGRALAVVRLVGGRTRLEFPPGRTLYEGFSIKSPRFSPRGDRIAFFERRRSGSVMVTASSGGGVKAIADGFDLPGGAPCWTADGREVWFTGTPEQGRPSGLHAAGVDGKIRLVAQMPGELELDDISRDGRVLLAHHTLINSMRAWAAGDSAERDVTWLDFSIPSDISADGKTILFSELGEGGGKTSAVYLRNIDGSPAVRLGEGQALALSPDGKSVLVRFPDAADRFVLLPTGTGEPKSLPLSGFEAIDVAAWLPDGKAFIFGGQEAGKEWRVYRLDAQGGKPRAISPEGIRIPFFMTGPVSSDGRVFFGARGPGKWFRFPMEGGEERPIAGLERGEVPIRWAADRSLWVRKIGSGEVWRLDPETGRRAAAAARLKADFGNVTATRIVMTPDGRSYVYSAQRAHSILYVVEGLR
ncbi:MAG TPA: protein kinase [Thermoanaerobaculia bacterium]|nr:protein kinase [Thermoanaerobaculia bacterium]